MACAHPFLPLTLADELLLCTSGEGGTGFPLRDPPPVTCRLLAPSGRHLVMGAKQNPSCRQTLLIWSAEDPQNTRPLKSLECGLTLADTCSGSFLSALDVPASNSSSLLPRKQLRGLDQLFPLPSSHPGGPMDRGRTFVPPGQFLAVGSLALYP